MANYGRLQLKLTEQVYQHRPLRARTSIRLLTLFPGEHGEPLFCRFAEHENVSDANYAALSYTWGDPEFPYAVYIRNTWSLFEQYIPVTQNLPNALQRMRDREQERTFWVDALCINQLDVFEKSHQVGHMDQIYRRAGRVLVWLGDEGEVPLLEAYIRSTLYQKPRKRPRNHVEPNRDHLSAANVEEISFRVPWYA